MSDRGEAIARWISAQLGALSLDELRVLEHIVDRVRKGQDVYGKLDLKADRRDFRKEAADELTDWFWYRAMREVAEADAQSAVEPGLAELVEATRP